MKVRGYMYPQMKKPVGMLIYYRAKERNPKTVTKHIR
jgi:hypothetical protein